MTAGGPGNTSHGGAGSAGGNASPANGSGNDGMMVKGGSQAKQQIMMQISSQNRAHSLQPR